MRHLDPAELVRGVAGERLSGNAGRHAETCSSCANELRRLGNGVGVLLTPPSVVPPSGPGCLDELAIAAFVDAGLGTPAHDVAVAHLAGCERCRVAVSSVMSALAQPDIAAVTSELGRTRRSGRFLAISGALVGAAAVAALLLVSSSPVQDSVPHRDGASSAGTPVTISPEGPSRSVQVLRWHSVPGADRYRVTLFEPDGAVLHEAVVADTMAALPDTIDLEPGRSYYWLVSARTDVDRWSTSALSEFSVDGAR